MLELGLANPRFRVRVRVRVSVQCYLEVGYDRFATTITIKTIKVFSDWLDLSCDMT